MLVREGVKIIVYNIYLSFNGDMLVLDVDKLEFNILVLYSRKYVYL